MTAATAAQPAVSRAPDSKAPEIKPDVDRLVSDALDRLTTISTLPEVTVQIIRIVEDPKSSAAQLHAIVSHDPALVARVMKVVNSSFYGLPGQVGSIERAIVLLGLNGVKNLAVAASLGQMFRGVRLCDQFGPRDLWTHCVAVAVAARELANRLALPISDEAFLAGMIHDVGILAQLQLWPEKIRQVCDEAQQKQGSAEFCDIERRVIGLDHEQLGRGLAQRWHFPHSCQEVAGNHHHPAGANKHGHLVGLVHIADVLCCRMKQGFYLTAMGRTVGEAEINQIGLQQPVYDEVVQQLPEKFAQAEALFG
jgi:HD-like signal output (HDOD) protein